MLRSDAPCAIALMLMFCRPSESNTFPATPGRPFIPSPTTARIAWSSFTSTCIDCAWNSNWNSCRIASTARAASALRTLKQIVCSDDACEIRTTLTPFDASVPNTRPATPGTPTMPGPRSVSSARSPTDVIPFASFPSSTALREISVPGASGLNVFLMRIGMRFATAGAIVAECSTFAPKYDSSIASS